MSVGTSLDVKGVVLARPEWTITRALLRFGTVGTPKMSPPPV